jgi:hypothetical protein
MSEAPWLRTTRASCSHRIIHDGLLGDAFLRRHVVTFDVAEERIVFG